MRARTGFRVGIHSDALPLTVASVLPSLETHATATRCCRRSTSAYPSARCEPLPSPPPPSASYHALGPWTRSDAIPPCRHEAFFMPQRLVHPSTFPPSIAQFPNPFLGATHGHARPFWLPPCDHGVCAQEMEARRHSADDAVLVGTFCRMTLSPHLLCRLC